MDYGGTPTISTISNLNVSSYVLHVPDSTIWRYRCGHVSHAKLEMLCEDFPSTNVNKDVVCDIFHFASERIISYTLRTNKVSSPFDLIHLDFWGSGSLPTIHAYMYFQTVVGDHTRHTWIVLLKSKLEVKVKVTDFISTMENQFSKIIKV